MNSQNPLKIAIFCLLLSLFSGCGYHFGNVQRGIPGGYDKVTVPVFSNRTAEVGVEPYFTTALIEEFERSHAVRVTKGTDAQVIIDGEISSITFVQGALVGQSATGDFKNFPADAVLAKEYRLVIVVNLNLRRISDNTILWSGNFSGEQRYAAPQVSAEPINSVNPLYNQSAKHLTMQVLSKTMMSEAYDRLTENF